MMLGKKKWNQGDLEQNPFAMQRQRAVQRVQIAAPAERVFELACQAGQPAWLPADSTRLHCSDSGRDEENALWSERETGPDLLQSPDLQTYWTTTAIDPRALAYQAVLLWPELAVGTLDLTLEQRDGSTTARLELSCTVISEAGAALFDDGMARRLRWILDRLGSRLADAVATGAPRPVVRSPHQSRRQRRTHESVINGPIDDCFALACPVAELLWVDDWGFDLIYSESGRNETGCAFLEPASGLAMLRCPGANTTWYTTLYDAGRHRFEAVWITRELTTARWRVQMTDLGEGQTRVTWSLTYTGLSPEGSRILGESGLDARMDSMLQFVARSMKHYQETGAIFRLPAQRKLQIAASLAGAALGRHFRRRRGL